jgi:dTMP kinase
MRTGRFIVLEGGEGSGKTTQAKRLVQCISAIGRDAVLTHEPGHTRLGDELRLLLLHEDLHLDARAELLLLLADRAQHVAEVVRPALAAGRVVVSDRFTPSSMTYQGVGRGLGVEHVDGLSRFASADLEPDLTIVLDLPHEVAAQRVSATPDRMEQAGDNFHRAVREAYRSLARRYGWRVIDASGSRDDVATRVWAEVEPVLSSPSPL